MACIWSQEFFILEFLKLLLAKCILFWVWIWTNKHRWGLEGNNELLIIIRECVYQLYPALSDATDCSQPTSCPWNFSGRKTECVVISFSRGFSWPRNWNPESLHFRWSSALQVDSLLQSQEGSSFSNTKQIS